MKNGSKFGLWTVFHKDSSKRRGRLCQCACGTTRVVSEDNLKSGKSVSCGCRRRITSAQNGRRNLVHGLSGSPTFKSWESMRERCFNEKHKSYSGYGGSGITVCKGLYQSVSRLTDVIGIRPKDTSLDRIDGRGNYSCGACGECKKKRWPLNVRWATATQQNRNRKNNRVVTIDGVTKLAADWAEDIGLKPNTFWQRLDRGETGDELLAPLHPRTKISPPRPSNSL